MGNSGFRQKMCPLLEQIFVSGSLLVVPKYIPSELIILS